VRHRHVAEAQLKAPHATIHHTMPSLLEPQPQPGLQVKLRTKLDFQCDCWVQLLGWGRHCLLGPCFLTRNLFRQWQGLLRGCPVF
jgi:hypothetical protein